MWVARLAASENGDRREKEKRTRWHMLLGLTTFQEKYISVLVGLHFFLSSSALSCCCLFPISLDSTVSFFKCTSCRSLEIFSWVCERREGEMKKKKKTRPSWTAKERESNAIQVNTRSHRWCHQEKRIFYISLFFSFPFVTDTKIVDKISGRLLNDQKKFLNACVANGSLLPTSLNIANCFLF